jgi:hypothetical protein
MRSAMSVAACLIGFAGGPALAQQTTTCASERDAEEMASIGETRQLSEIIGVRSCWDANVANDKQQYLNDLYGRWVIEELTADRSSQLVRSYRLEKRGAIARLFMGRSNGLVAAVRLKVRDPDIEFTIPLVAVQYNGRSGEGQAFVTSITTSDMSMPDFRVSANSSVSIEASARQTNDVDVQSASVALTAIKDSLAIAAPSGSLLTSVNREQVQRVATAYDTAISKLLSTTIAEATSAGRLMSEWYPGASFIVAVEVPDTVKTMTRSASRRLLFRVSMACPRPSVFDTASVCETGTLNLRMLINSPYRTAGNTARYAIGKPGFTGDEYRALVKDMGGRVSAQQVLSFRLGVGKSLRQYIIEQEWFLSLSKKMVDPSSSEQLIVGKVTSSGDDRALPEKEKEKEKVLRSAQHAANEFCSAVIDKLFSAGLSQLDAKIGLWAIATGIPDFAVSRGYFQSAAGCRNLLPGKDWTFMTS